MRLIGKIITAGFVILSLAGANEALAAGKGRERILRGSDKTLREGQTRIDFEQAEIGGRTRTPMMDDVTSRAPDRKYDFIKVRLRWHPEMVQSVSALSAN